MSASKMTSIPVPEMASRNPRLRSWPGVEVISPFNSTTLPLPPSFFTSHSPAARPIFLLSAPMKHVYLSPNRLRSSTITGICASIALPTGSVKG